MVLFFIGQYHVRSHTQLFTLFTGALNGFNATQLANIAKKFLGCLEVKKDSRILPGTCLPVDTTDTLFLFPNIDRRFGIPLNLQFFRNRRTKLQSIFSQRFLHWGLGAARHGNGG